MKDHPYFQRDNSGAKPQNIRIMQWNVLSDFRGRGFYSKDITESDLSWAKRQPIIIKKIKEADPDVFGVCDIDAGKNFTSFKAELNKLGYDQQYKSNETLMLCIFYKRTKFELVRTAYYAFEERSTGAQNLSDNDAISQMSFDGTQEMLVWCHLRTNLDKKNKKEFMGF